MIDGQSPKYIIDTCALIHLEESYPAETFPSVWSKMEELVNSGVLLSCEEVYYEIQGKDDTMAEWAKDRKQIFFPINDEIQILVTQILTSHTNLLDVKKNKSGADPFVIATAKHLGCAVVTDEKPSGSIPIRFNIPDVCPDYDIKCLSALEMLISEGLRA